MLFHVVPIKTKSDGLTAMAVPGPTRRRFLASTATFAAAAALAPAGRAADRPMTRTIPSTGEAIPAVGLGSWISFNVGDDPVLLDASAEVMRAFFAAGGRVIDSSPMYGSSQATIGYGLQTLGSPGGLFSADKVWTSAGSAGPAQIEASRRNWTVPGFSLLQVHNLRAWEDHLPTLYAMKEAGDLRYVGITTSEGRRHDLFEQVMLSEPLDFVQITYNILDREVEERILPIARERGMGVIVNRPFRQGALTRRLEREPVPDWAGEIGATTWAQIILKFILSHPAVTVAIPATTRPDHARENVAAARGPLPNRRMRERMADSVRSL
jgi:diketogulonate reductase-like aldo/keto reductase